MVYKRTITKFIADDKVVYQRVRWAKKLASDNSWARRCLKHLSLRLRWIILYTIERGMLVLRDISQADQCILACLPDWARGPPPSQCCLRYTLNTVCRCLVAGHCTRLSDCLQQTVDAFRFPPLSRNSLYSLCAPCPLKDRFFYQNCIFMWNFHDFM